MKNPWHDYFVRSNESKCHPLDEQHVLAFNDSISAKKSVNKFRLRVDMEPLPYTGNPSSPILVLLANPGAGGSGPEITKNFTGKKLELHKKNLLHTHSSTYDYLARFNSPKNTQLESVYLKEHTQELAKLTSIESVAKNIFFVNYHAYQSKAWYPIPFTFPTQDYTFFLVEEAVRRNALILMKRNMLGWFTAVPPLAKHKNIGVFKSSRRISMTAGNLDTPVFNEVLKRLR